jgi:hypothetical protein
MEKLAKKFGGAGGPMGGGFPGFPGWFSFICISYNFFMVVGGMDDEESGAGGADTNDLD